MNRTHRFATFPGLGAALGALLLLSPVGAEEALSEAPPRPVEDGTYLQPTTRLPDGKPGYVHLTEADMPWRVSVGTPKTPPKYGSSEQARAVAIDAMREWERAIQKRVPWFVLEFAEDDPGAPVQVRWKRRIPGPWGGFGRITTTVEDERLRVGGEMQVSTTPGRFVTLTLEQVKLLIAHEFGHVLGLGHCLDCDSAMNYSWHTRDRVLVTELDVETFARLLAIPNGSAAE